MKDRYYCYSLHLMRQVQLMWHDVWVLKHGIEPWQGVAKRVQVTCEAWADAERAFDRMLLAADEMVSGIADGEPWTEEERRAFDVVNILALPFERPPEVAAWMFPVVAAEDAKDCEVRLSDEARIQAYRWHHENCDRTAASIHILIAQRRAVKDRRN